MEEVKCRVTYRSFDPLDISIMCTEKETYTGKISVCIPDVDILLLDLSMGMREMKGAGAYSKGDMQIATVDVENISVSKIYDMFLATATHFKEFADIVREHLKTHPMLG